MSTRPIGGLVTKPGHSARAHTPSVVREKAASTGRNKQRRIPDRAEPAADTDRQKKTHNETFLIIAYWSAFLPWSF